MTNMKQKLVKGDGIPFTQISNEMLHDSRLSAKSKGLCAYLYSKPDNWDFNGDRIAKDMRDGRESIYSGLKELENAGYITRQKKSDGRMIYTIYVHPVKEKPVSEKPKVGKTQSGKTRNISNKEYKKTKIIKQTKTGRCDPLGSEVIKAFEAVDPKNKAYYANTTQRSACDFLIAEYGLNEALKRIQILPILNKIPYFPIITTPVQLRDKWVQLDDAVARYKAKSGKNNIAFVS